MKKQSRILTSMGVAALMLSASRASAQTPAYSTTYYSDSSHHTVVGHIRWTGCNRWGQPTYQLWGTQTAYSDQELAGYCDGTVMERA